MSNQIIKATQSVEATKYFYSPPTDAKGNRRDWTLGELQDMIFHAQCNDATDNTKVELGYGSSITVALPVDPREVSKMPTYRYVPNDLRLNGALAGALVGLTVMGFVWMVVALGFTTLPFLPVLLLVAFGVVGFWNM